MVKSAIYGPELAADALHERPHIHAMPLSVDAGDETFPVHQVVNFAVGRIASRLADEQRNDVELGHREVDPFATPGSALAVVIEFQFADSLLPFCGSSDDDAWRPAINEIRLSTIEKLLDFSMKSTAPPSSAASS